MQFNCSIPTTVFMVALNVLCTVYCGLWADPLAVFCVLCAVAHCTPMCTVELCPVVRYKGLCTVYCVLCLKRMPIPDIYHTFPLPFVNLGF